ncbi:MAG: MMPL family transporter [Bacteriovoracaceae bacterium]
MNNKTIDKIVKLILKYRVLILIFSMLGSLVGFYFTVKLYSNINSDLESLLSKNSPTIKNLEESRKRFKLSDYTLIFILAKNSDDGKKFTEELNKELQAAKHPLVLRTTSEIGEELAYFEKNQLLFGSVAEFYDLDLKLFPKPKTNQVKSKKEQIEENFETIRRNFKKQLAFGRANLLNNLLKIPEHKLASFNGLTRGIIVFHSEPIYKIEDAKSIDQFLKRCIDKLNPKSFGQGIEVKVSGAAPGIAAESDALFSDIISSISITLIFVTILLLVFYKNIRVLAVLIYVLTVGTTLSFIVTYYFINELNSFTAFLCSIIIGNNINSGVIFLSLYIQNLKKNKNVLETIMLTFHKAITPTLLGCITTASAFGCLIFSNFRGYSEFGWIGMWGMVIGGCSTFIFLPALLSLNIFKLSDKYIDSYQVPLVSCWNFVSMCIAKFHRKNILFFYDFVHGLNSIPLECS